MSPPWLIDHGGPGTPVLFINGLGTTAGIWRPYLAELRPVRTVLRYDFPGHGGYPATELPGGMPDLAAQALGVLDEAEVAQAHVVGLSLGGMVAQWLGIHAPARIATLTVVSATSALATPQYWLDRAGMVRAEGMAVVAEASAARWFTESFRRDHPDVAASVVAQLLACDPAGYAACCEAIGTFDVTDYLPRIGQPTLVIGGECDPVTSPAMTRQFAAAIPAARYELVPAAAHLLTLEQPDTVVAALQRHFTGSEE